MIPVERNWFFVMMTSRKQFRNVLNVYHEQTQPLIDYYTKKGILKSVDGTKDLEEVFADIVAILGE